MACVVTSDGAVYTVHYSAASGVRVSEGPILGEAIQSASHGGRAGVYYLTTAAPQSLKLCCGSTKTSVTELPMPCVKLVSYRHKLYGLGRDGCHLLIYDPLCAMTEVIDLSTPMANFEPADHGFVFTTAEGRVWGYHFNHGLSSFLAAASPATLVGYHRSAALVRLPDGTISAASETAALTALPSLAALPSTANAFVGVDDDGTIAAVSGATVHVLTKSGVVTQSLPITNTTSALCVCPIPSEEAAEDEEEPTCALCLCEFDGGDGLVLDCGHQLHADCVRMWVQKWLDFKAKAEHIVFTHAVCPAGCRRLVRHPQVEESVPVGKLHATVRAAKMEVLERLANPSKTEDDLLFYLCHRCEAPYFGGDKVCPRMMGGEPAKAPSDLLCEKCRNDFSCPDHQREWVVYKCRYCCNPATHMCFGSRYLCERCEGRWANTEPECIPCPGAATCPLGGNHSEKGSYPVGCLLTLPSTGNGLNWDKVVAPEPSP